MTSEVYEVEFGFDGEPIGPLPQSGQPPAPGASQQPQPQQPDDEVRPTVLFAGERFAVRERVSLLPLMQFATIARRQQTQQRAATRRGEPDTQQGQREMEALAALHDLLQQCIAEDEWGAFYEHALAVGAQQVDLMHVVTQAIAAASARPTQQPSGSPAGQWTTAPNSGAGSSSPDLSPLGVQRRLEAQGRPDLAFAVAEAQRATSSTGSAG